MYFLKLLKRDRNSKGFDAEVRFFRKERGETPENTDGILLCRMDTWGFSSCAVHILHTFNLGYGEDLVDLFNYLMHEDTNVGTGYRPKEIYFLLSSVQARKDDFQTLLKNEHVKKVDSFSNKSHGPNLVHLYRFSLLKDFPCTAITSST